MKFGTVDVVEQIEQTNLQQEAASAWFSIMGDICGATYKPIAYVGGQPVRGVNHIFIAEQTLFLANLERHIVSVTINDFNGNFNLVSIERIF